MDHSELAFYPTEELVKEILRRKTFLGVVIQSEEEYRQQSWGAERMFKVQFNSNLTNAQASRLIDSVAEFMQSEEYNLDGEKQ
jgi:hypothetical protein